MLRGTVAARLNCNVLVFNNPWLPELLNRNVHIYFLHEFVKDITKFNSILNLFLSNSIVNSLTAFKLLNLQVEITASNKWIKKVLPALFSFVRRITKVM